MATLSSTQSAPSIVTLTTRQRVPEAAYKAVKALADKADAATLGQIFAAIHRNPADKDKNKHISSLSTLMRTLQLGVLETEACKVFKAILVRDSATAPVRVQEGLEKA